MNAVKRGSSARGVARLVLFALADYANDDGLAWPSVESLQEWANADRRSVQRAIRELCEAGEIVLISPGGGRNQSAKYQIGIEALTANKQRRDAALNEAQDDGNSGVTPPNSEEKGGRLPLIESQKGGILSQKGGISSVNSGATPPDPLEPLEPLAVERDAREGELIPLPQQDPPEIEAARLWNEAADRLELRKGRTIWAQASPKNKQHVSAIKARLKECDGLDGWRHFLACASTNPFWTNPKGGPPFSVLNLTRANHFATIMDQGETDERSHDHGDVELALRMLRG